jgi:cytochrome c553
VLFANQNPEEIKSEISSRIAQLNSLSEANLKEEMRELKTALKENPAACALLMDEDIGMLVSALRKLTHKDVTEAESKPKRGTKPKAEKVQLTAEQLAAALDDDDF